MTKYERLLHKSHKLSIYEPIDKTNHDHFSQYGLFTISYDI